MTMRGAAASLLLASSLGAQVRLQSPTMVVDAAFNHISGVRELSNGHLLVIDQTDNQVWDVDVSAKTRVLAGASGTGSLEYEKPTVLFVAGQSTIVEDFVRKFLVFSAGGKPIASIGRDSLFTREMRRLSPRFGGADDDGRLYFELPLITIDASTGAHASDSSAIVRVDRKEHRVDTLAFLRLPAGSNRASGGRPGEGMSIMTGVDNPFSPHPAWVVSGDDSVAIVNAAPYRVDWIDAKGARRSGPTIAYDKIPVTPADISAAPAGLGASSGGGVGIRGTGASVPTSGGRDDWPSAKSPFVRGDVRIDTRGRVWVRRSSRAGDSTSSYDVFDRSGRVVARYSLPERTRVVAAGPSSVYAVLATDDGERLELFRLP